MSPDHREPEPTRPAPDPAEAETHTSLLGAKVMMVDDEPLMTDLVQAHLEDEGYGNFVVSNDSSQALALLRREQPDVLLLDLMMPGVSGFDVLQAMRADPELRYTPVIVLTAATGADAKLRALRLGATDFLSKPVDSSELTLRLRNTLAFQQYRDRLMHYDRVTGLPNDRLFERSVDEMLADRPPGAGLLALFSIMVPECRTLHESVDRRTAEELALVLAQRLQRLAVGAQPLQPQAADRRLRAARLSEQRFGLVIDGLADGDAVEAAAEQVLARLSEPISLGAHEVAPVPWLGIAVAPDDGECAGDLRQSADLAATHGRQQGASQLCYASPELNAKSYQRLLLGAQLRGAAQRGELRLYYQPKVDLASGRMVGVEALLRWQHPQHGLVPPLQFISLAEELGLMAGIGQWVIEQACRDTATWARAGLGEISVSVNVSKPQFVTGNLAAVVKRALAASGLAARLLVIELTESMLMNDVQRALTQMLELKAVGVTLSIDDFGTGYSSLAYLKRFPLQELKIDRSFVSDLPGLPADVALVRTIIDLGHSLGMTVTAEGVETQDQLACLKQLGCDTFQGYLYSQALPALQCRDLLRARQRDGAAGPALP